MIQIAIVDDENEASQTLKSYLDDYFKKCEKNYSILTFDDAVSFLNNYKANYDVIFMDIQMPYLNGINAAKKLREIDNIVNLVFVTNLRQYAIEGYSVNAIDYIVKPYTYYAISSVMDKVIKKIDLQSGKDIIAKNKDQLYRIQIKTLKYVEVQHHLVTFHTEEGIIKTWGSLTEIEKQLPDEMFAKCNSCYLINMSYIDKIDAEDCIIKDERLKISRNKRKDFLSSVAKYFGANK